MKILKITDNFYPFLLKQIYNPPRSLYYKGEISALEKTCISIVGTRKYSDYGEFMTQKIIEEIAVLDVAIVSGLARGVDTIAHKTALKNNIPTIAVLGSGLNNIYPRENQKLTEEITKNGLVISEYEPDKEPLNFHFPQRNRIISGLCVATIVIEAPEKSGALITARLALEQGREIFTLTGDADRENSLGPLRLMQRGAAYPISSGSDIIEVLNKQPHLFKVEEPKKTNPSLAAYNLTKQEFKILDAMPTRRPTTLEQIQIKTALQPQSILITLSLLEIKGLIATKNGKYMRKLVK